MSYGEIKYYGPQDMSAGWHLRDIEEFFMHWDENIRYLNINTVLILYNIKQYTITGGSENDPPVFCLCIRLTRKYGYVILSLQINQQFG